MVRIPGRFGHAVRLLERIHAVQIGPEEAAAQSPHLKWRRTRGRRPSTDSAAASAQRDAGKLTGTGTPHGPRTGAGAMKTRSAPRGIAAPGPRRRRSGFQLWPRTDRGTVSERVHTARAAIPPCARRRSDGGDCRLAGSGLAPAGVLHFKVGQQAFVTEPIPVVELVGEIPQDPQRRAPRPQRHVPRFQLIEEKCVFHHRR